MLNIVAIAKHRSFALTFVYLEFATVLVVALLLYLAHNVVSAYSVLLGGAVYFVPNICFIICGFRNVAAPSPQLMLSWFYLAEVVKLLLTLVLFALCFALVKPLNIGLFFAVYSVMLLLNVLAMVLLKDGSPETQNLNNILKES